MKFHRSPIRTFGASNRAGTCPGAVATTQNSQAVNLAATPRWRAIASYGLAVLGVVLSTSALAQTATTRSSQTVYSHYSVFGQENGASTWKQYGYVKFDVAVREPSQGRLGYTISRIQPVETATNATMAITQQACVVEPVNGQERLRCYYTVKTTVNSNIASLKTTTTWKGSGSGSVGAALPKGADFSLDVSGEKGGEIVTEVKPGYSFSRSFEFVVQLHDPCDRNPAYSVYYQGGGSYPQILNARCLYSPPSPPDYCGKGQVLAKKLDGTIDGMWQYESETNPWKTLTVRTYRLYRNYQPTTQTYQKTCAIQLSGCHVFDSHRWDTGAKRINFTWAPVTGNPSWCTWFADEYDWDNNTNSYSISRGKQNVGGCGCPGSNYSAGSSPVFSPSTSY